MVAQKDYQSVGPLVISQSIVDCIHVWLYFERRAQVEEETKSEQRIENDVMSQVHYKGGNPVHGNSCVGRLV
jgi:hypothetical protein